MGKKIFTFGGARSHDIRDGILEPTVPDWAVDYIITHAGPNSVIDILSRGFCDHDKLTDYLEEVRIKTALTRWFFGHYHDNREIGENFVLLYEQMIYAAGLDKRE